MNCRKHAVVWAGGIVAIALAARSLAEPRVDLGSETVASLAGSPKMVPLAVRVVDGADRPVGNVRVTPWALRSSQGHGWWRKDDKAAGVGPRDAMTDASGNATVVYPYYRDRKEQTRTTSVSLNADHPELAYKNDLHIDVPLESDTPHVITLAAGIPVKIRPVLDGEPAGVENVFAFWSDGRSWSPGSTPQKLADGVLRIPALPSGDNSVLLARLEDEQATHFSKITDFTLKPGEPRSLDVALLPAVRVRGVLSDNVPRPVRKGRIKAQTLPPADAHWDRVGWFTWAPIQADGTFTIPGWPAGEPMQLIALCDGYTATSGAAPSCVKDPPDPATDRFGRPQVFEPGGKEPIELAMTPLACCVVTAVDEDEKRVAGVRVVSWPNVAWWNGGSQIYCHPLARGERLLRARDYFTAIEEAFPQPFAAETDAQGRATLELPAGREDLAVMGEVYELPVFLGNRAVRVALALATTTEVTLRLQPRGTEKLGEWDKLAGVVFGCSTREGRRICALPSVQKQMEQFIQRFRDGKNQRDPQLLHEAYTLVADAFTGAGDAVEAATWRQKAAEQARLAELAKRQKAAKEP